MGITKQRRDELIADLARANRMCEDQLKLAAERFSRPVLPSCREPAWLALALSERYKTLTFWVSYEGGNQSVHAEPSFKPFEVGGHDSYLENQVQSSLAEARKADTRWPSFEEVAAFAAGYDKACPKLREMEDLKKEAESNRRDAYPFPMMGPMMMGPWGRYFR